MVVCGRSLKFHQNFVENVENLFEIQVEIANPYFSWLSRTLNLKVQPLRRTLEPIWREIVVDLQNFIKNSSKIFDIFPKMKSYDGILIFPVLHTY